MLRFISLIGVVSLLLTGCSLGILKDTASDSEEKEPKKAITQEEEPKEDEKTQDEGSWDRYEGDWKDNFNGLKTEITEIGLNDKFVPERGIDKEPHPAVAVSFKIKNTTDEVFTTYPTQATLVTSTGEQLRAEATTSDHDLSGEIHEGVLKEGKVIFYLKRSKTDEIEWVKLQWQNYSGSTSDDASIRRERKTMEAKLQLQK
ncbi:hypothetical protein GXN76_14185 [Kroppenstedtia pulmonis]|uniref:DUF4352 domain-containing protein n=1 Tax=Kroppenstedtia pulmonis TaxID=1380685 RepID=A0A7D3XPA9_9BACL|nr:hypothetical protein [Kroppenstedtia pulmonis]QKG85489.1 hypothetical protein GXN76_14185 [Kroppenstedtia pulmonis]